MTLADWPLLEVLVAVPLAAALWSVVAGRRGALALLVAVSTTMCATALALWGTVTTDGPRDVALGGWQAPLGIGLHADGLSAAFVLTCALIMPAVAACAYRAFAPRIPEQARRYTFWPLFYAMWTALNAVFLGRDLFSLYVALELLTIAAVGMVAYGSARAALRYLMVALLGSTAYLAGVMLIYATSGALDTGLLYRTLGDSRAVLLAGALMTAGLLAKTALFPLHAWLPPAHAGAPAPGSALLSALVIKASFLILLRIWFDLMPDAGGRGVTPVLGALGAAAIVYGSLLAIVQTRLKRIVAYSTVAQVGYLFLVFPLAGGAAYEMPWAAGAWTGGVLHALAHAFAKAAMFLAAGLVIEALGHDRLGGMKGLARAMPLTLAAFALAAVSLMGLPPSGGFMAKYLMLTSALAAGQVGYALVMLAGGLLAALYLFRPLNRALKRHDVVLKSPVALWRQAVPFVLAAIAVAMGIAVNAPYALLQIGRPLAAEEGIE